MTSSNPVIAELKACPREPTMGMAAAGQWAQLSTVNPPVSLCVEANFLARKIWEAMWLNAPTLGTRVSTPPPAGDDLVETVARALCKASGEHWFGSDRFQKDNWKWTLLARAALEAVRSTREGEIERLRGALRLWLAYDDLDEADFAQAGPMLLYARAIDATRQALNKGTDEGDGR